MSHHKNLTLLIKSGVPVMVWGDPGIGKSAIMGSIAAALDHNLETLIASIREPSDFGGIPYVNPKTASLTLAIPDWAQRVIELGTPSIVFFDEITTCPNAIQAAILRIILDKVVADTNQLPPYTCMVAAGNLTNVSGTSPLTHPLANRFVHYRMEANGLEWSRGIISGFAAPKINIPDNWENRIPYYIGLISRFITINPDLIHVMPEDESTENAAWPSPRSWEASARVMAVSQNEDQDLVEMFLTGTVGAGAASSFVEWWVQNDLEDIESLLADPENYQLPDRPDIVHVLVSAIVKYVESSSQYVDGAKIIFRRLFDEGHKSIIVRYGKELVTALKLHGPVSPKDFEYVVEVMRLL